MVLGWEACLYCLDVHAWLEVPSSSGSDRVMFKHRLFEMAAQHGMGLLIVADDKLCCSDCVQMVFLGNMIPAGPAHASKFVQHSTLQSVSSFCG